MTGTIRATAKFDLHLFWMIIYTFGRPATIQTFSSRDTSTWFCQCLYGLDAQLFTSAWTQRVYYQQNQVRMGNLLYAEWPVKYKIKARINLLNFLIIIIAATRLRFFIISVCKYTYLSQPVS